MLRPHRTRSAQEPNWQAQRNLQNDTRYPAETHACASDQATKRNPGPVWRPHVHMRVQVRWRARTGRLVKLACVCDVILKQEPEQSLLLPSQYLIRPLTLSIFDGNLKQIHRLEDGRMMIYSRNSENTSNKYPDIMEKIGTVRIFVSYLRFSVFYNGGERGESAEIKRRLSSET